MILTAIEKASTLIKIRKKAQAIRQLKIAIALLQSRMQRLPKWAVPGARILCTGEEPHDTYTIASVNRGSRGNPWSIQCEETSKNGSKIVTTFHQEYGRRYWKQAK